MPYNNPPAPSGDESEPLATPAGQEKWSPAQDESGFGIGLERVDTEASESGDEPQED